MKRSTLAATGMMLAILVGITGCGSPGTSAVDSYRIGFSTDLSGKFAQFGTGQRDGFKAYFDYVNVHGGLDGHPVEVTYLDDAGDVSRGTANATQLIAQNSASALAGYAVSNVCGGAASVATTQKIPLICTAVASDLLEPVRPYVYAARIAQAHEAAPMMAFAGQLTGKAAPRVAVITLGTAAGASLHDGLVSGAGNKGWTVVADESVPVNASDVTAQASKIIAASPEVIVGALPDALAVPFMRSLQTAKVTLPFIDYDGATLDGALLPLKDPNLYVLSSVTLTGQGDGTYLEQYREATRAAGIDPTHTFVNVGYVQALQIGESLKSCGFPCDGQKMQLALDKLDIDTGGLTSGAVSFSPDIHEGTSSGSFYVWDPATSAVKTAAADLSGGATS
jgi:branched-chain amino acid transport system substrate-binding protein